MKAVVRLRREAKIDLLHHYTYIGEQDLDAAKRFLQAARVDMEKLAEMPGIGAIREFAHPLLSEVRSWPIGGFRNHPILYQPRPDGISVIAVMHGARDIERALEARV